MVSALNDDFDREETARLNRTAGRGSVEEMARQAEGQPPERFVPASQPVAPMYPNPPPPGPEVYAPPQIHPAGNDVSPATREILRERSADTAPPPPFYNRGQVLPERQPNFALDPNAPAPPPPIPGAPLGSGPAGVPEEGAPASALGGTPPPPPIPEAPPAEVAPPPIPGAPKLERPRGHGGRSTSATEPRTDYPAATDKMQIDPYYLVNLEKTNPALHDSIVQAATAAGVSSGELANLVYASSKGDPNYLSKDGREGLTGLTKEDVDKYRKLVPDLFIDPQGNPITKLDPATNLVLGAQKYRELSDKFGAKTPGALIANYLGEGRTEQIANMTPDEQKKYIPPEAAAHLAEATGGPNAKKDAPVPVVNGGGTMTATGATQAAVQAAQTGEPQIFATYMANGLPHGMTPTDGWRHTEALMVGARLARGDVDGAQRARELVFQMSHVGAVQSLMRGLQLMGPDGKGDLQGAAYQLAKAYWYTPDGSMAKIYVTDKGLVGERFNEATGVAVGGKFAITPQLVQGMINMTQDPQTYLKTLRDSTKLNADVEETHAKTKKLQAEVPEIEARTGLIKAQTKYEELKPDLELTKTENLLTARILKLQSDLAKGPNAQAEATLATHLDSLAKEYWNPKNLDGSDRELTPVEGREQAVWRDMMKINRPDPGFARSIAKGMTKGDYVPRVVTEGDLKGYGIFHDKAGKSIGIVVSPGTMRLITGIPATPTSPPRAGAAPSAPPAG